MALPHQGIVSALVSIVISARLVRPMSEGPTKKYPHISFSDFQISFADLEVPRRL